MVDIVNADKLVVVVQLVDLVDIKKLVAAIHVV